MTDKDPIRPLLSTRLQTPLQKATDRLRRRRKHQHRNRYRRNDSLREPYMKEELARASEENGRENANLRYETKGWIEARASFVQQELEEQIAKDIVEEIVEEVSRSRADPLLIVPPAPRMRIPPWWEMWLRSIGSSAVLSFDTVSELLQCKLQRLLVLCNSIEAEQYKVPLAQLLSEEKRDISEYQQRRREELRKRWDYHYEPVHKRPGDSRDILHQSVETKLADERAVKTRRKILNNTLPADWSRRGSRSEAPSPERHIRRPSQRLSQSLTMSPATWFENPKTNKQRRGILKDDRKKNVFTQQKTFDINNGEMIQKYRKDNQRFRKQIDATIRKSKWNDKTTSTLVYQQIKHQITRIVQLYYGNYQGPISERLHRYDGVIVQQVQYAVSAAELMRIIAWHFVEQPLFGKPGGEEKKLTEQEYSLRASIDGSLADRLNELRRFRRSNIQQARAGKDHDLRQGTRVQKHMQRIMTAMVTHEQGLVKSSQSLKSALESDLMLLSELAYNWGMLLRTSDILWNLHWFAPDDEIRPDAVEVLGKIDGFADEGPVAGCVLGLTVFPALLRNQEGTVDSMIVQEKADIVIDRLWEPSRT